MPSKFALAMKAKAAAWKKARKAEPRKGGTRGPADVPDGQYEATISAKSGITERGKNAGVPWVEIIATISDGEHIGKEPRNFYFLDGKTPSTDADAMPTNEEKLAGDLKTLMPDTAIEDLEADQIEQAIEELDGAGVSARIGVVNRIGKAGSNSAGKRFQDIYFNELLGGSGGSNGQQVQAQEDEGEEEGGEEVEEGEDEGEDAGEPVAPAKGDKVQYQPKGGKKREFEVKTVNQRQQTATVSDGKKQFSNVPWADLE